jgi:redox-sensitive bicupin YhaK (pirin superfamily)
MLRKITYLSKSTPVIEGAGVRLKRAFGFQDTSITDPFLLLDDFRGDDPADYIAGFPWHPHRGIETITYMLDGTVEHGDSMGNKGVIEPGCVQWMTAGSGIIHQEMPKGDSRGKMGGFQLWANLPKKQKMSPPKYRDVRPDDIPVVKLKSGATVRLICGELEGVKGPVHDIAIKPEYLDVTVSKGGSFSHHAPDGHTAIIYVVSGSGNFCGKNNMDREHLMIFGGDGDIEAVSGGKEFRFLLFTGKPLKEPVAWYGPIVMNTQEELELAFEEYQDGTFLKHKDLSGK